MTWLGKILTFVVMLMAVVAMFFMAQAYVTRTNWQARSDEYRDALKTSEEARRGEERRHQAEVDALRRQLGISQSGATKLAESNEKLTTAQAALRADFEKVQNGYSISDVTATRQGTNLAATLAELETLRKRATELDTAAVNAQLALELAKREETKAKNTERLTAAIARDYAAKIEELTARVNELRAAGGGGTNALSGINRPPPPLLPNTRGEVTDVAGDLLVVSIGIDSGLALNTVLEVSRADGTYLGTAKVTDVQGLFPKQAIVTFTPAKNVPLDRLPPAALPQKKDLVRPAVR